MIVNESPIVLLFMQMAFNLIARNLSPWATRVPSGIMITFGRVFFSFKRGSMTTANKRSIKLICLQINTVDCFLEKLINADV